MTTIDLAGVPAEYLNHLANFVEYLQHGIAPSFVAIHPDEIREYIVEYLDEIFDPSALEKWDALSTDEQWFKAYEATEKYDIGVFDPFASDRRADVLEALVDELGGRARWRPGDLDEEVADELLGSLGYRRIVNPETGDRGWVWSGGRRASNERRTEHESEL